MRWADSKFWIGVEQFVLPETTVSLKIVFDNVRNYGYCAIFAALAVALSKGIDLPRPFEGLATLSQVLRIDAAAVVLAGMLLLLNGYQTFLIVAYLFLPSKTDTPKAGRSLKGIGWTKLALFTVTVVVVTVGFMLVVVVVLALAAFLFWFLANKTV
jgi:hypothetical protein